MIFNLEKQAQQALNKEELDLLEKFFIKDVTRYTFQELGKHGKYLYQYTIEINGLSELVEIYKLLKQNLLITQNILGDLVIQIEE